MISFYPNHSDNRILITGAARGLGRSLAQKFWDFGWKVAATDLNLDDIVGSYSQIVDDSRFIGLELDVNKEQNFDQVRKVIEEKWGGLDILINNAGVASGGTVQNTSLKDWRWTIDTNLTGTFLGCHKFIPLLMRQKRAHIVNISSFAGIACAPGMAAYNVSKAAVISLSEGMRSELAKKNIGVTVSCPTFFQSNLLDDFRSDDLRITNAAKKMMQKSNLSADDVVNGIISAIIKNRFLEIPSAPERALVVLKKLAPGLFARLMSTAIR